MKSTTGRRAKTGTAAAVLVIALATAGSALAVDIRGTLRLSSELTEQTSESPSGEPATSWYWNVWNGFVEPASPRFDASRDLAVVLTGEGAMAEEQPGFRIANGNLWPRTLVHRAGSNLQIQNTDPCTHQLFVADHETFTPNPTMPGLTRQLTLTEAGAWEIRDSLYEHVGGYLHVVPDLVARAVVQPDGSYRFSGLEPGTYTLKVYMGASVIHTREEIEVTERELTIPTINLTRSDSGSASDDE